MPNEFNAAGARTGATCCIWRSHATGKREAWIRGFGEPDAPDVVLIHDAARPFVDPAIVERAVVSAQTYGAAAPGVALTDTVKQVNDQLMVVATPDRHCLRAVQTPQAFQFLLILEAHRKAADGLREYTDDAMIAEFAGYSVHLFLGDTKISNSQRQRILIALWT